MPILSLKATVDNTGLQVVALQTRILHLLETTGPMRYAGVVD